MGLIRCPESSANNYQSTLHNIPEEQRSVLFSFLPCVILVPLILSSIIFFTLVTLLFVEYYKNVSHHYAAFFHYPSTSTLSGPSSLLSTVLAS
jgi:hypothetical protein